MQRPAADIDGEIPYRDVILHQVPRQPATNASGQHDQRQPVLVQWESVAQLFDRNGEYASSLR